MTVYYVDPESGVDANAGTSFAQRRKTIAAITAANLVAGDSIRVIASRDPVSVGVNGTWTNGTGTVVLATACNATIDNGVTAWTASASVTASTQTSGQRKFDGATVTQLAIASGFTTGKVAYRAVGPLDLSAYQMVSLWFLCSTAVAAGALELRLCTDATGDVPVHTIPLNEQAAVAGGWRVVLKDLATNLNSAIASISIFANSDPGTVNLQLQNIIACKTNHAADSLTHLSLIKPDGGSEWYPISYIDGVTIGLGNGNSLDWNSATTTPRDYQGATVTSDLQKLEPHDMVNNGGTSPPGATANIIIQDNGTLAAPITVSGGWDRTDMSTQTGETWLSGSHWSANGISVGALDYINVSNFGMAHMTAGGVLISNGSTGINLDLIGVVGSIAAVTPVGTLDFLNITIGYVNSCMVNAVSLQSATTCDWTCTVGKMLNIGGTPTTTACVIVGVGTGFTGRLRVPIIDGCNPAAVNMTGTPGDLTVMDIVQTNSGSSNLVVQGASMGRDNLFINCTPVAATVSATTITVDGRRMKFHNADQSAGSHYTVGYYYTFNSQTAVRHTASGYAWKMSVGHATNRHSQRPVAQPLARYYAIAGVPITFKCWMRRSSTSLTCGIKVDGGSALGIPSDVSAAMTAAIDTWEEITLAAVTPTIDGVIELHGYAYGAVADCYFDDVTVED